MEEQYILSSSGNADRTEEILNCLNRFGICRLGPGDFYVSSLKMPEKSALSGCGPATRLILDERIEDGFIISLSSFSAVSDLCLSGAGELKAPERAVGTRHAIVRTGNYDRDNTAFPMFGMLHNLIIEGFSGGGITFHNTGYSVRSGLNVSDCLIRNCGAGINIDYWSEFNRFTGVQCVGNYIGAVNNGGNNSFVNCNFSGNAVGMLMENHGDSAPNNSHGNVIGCIFDHSDSNKGTGLKLIGMRNGEIFSGCQVFFSKIEIEDCDGMVFSSFNFGKDEVISVKGTGVVSFSDCVFRTMPQISIENEDFVRFNNCRVRDTGKIL